MKATQERWLPVVGYEGKYEVSSVGRVRGLDRLDQGRFVRGRELKPYRQSGNKHLTVGLRNAPWRRHAYVHQLVAEAFLGPRPDGLEICHNNGDPLDNRADNLRYDTQSANSLDSVRHGSHANAAKTHCKRGHEFTPENTKRQSHGGRQCKTCHDMTTKRSRERRRLTPAIAARDKEPK